MPESLKILIVDDHDAVRAGLREFFLGLEKSSISQLGVETVEIAGECASTEEALAILQPDSDQPISVDVVLIDVRLGKLDGLKLLEKIREKSQIPAIMLSSYDNPTYVARAATCDAQDFLSKSECLNQLVDSINRAITDQSPTPGGLMHRVLEDMNRTIEPRSFPAVSALTTRELQVLRHVALGLSNREIGRSMKISVETVKEHVQKVVRKTESHDRTAAAVKAVRIGLVN